MAGGGHGTKAVVAALLANTGIAIAKFVGFALTRSSSMLAESVHSVADAGNQGLLLLGGSRAKRDATAQHPFGYGRERYFWSFVVAVVLFALGSLFALYEGFEKLREPHAPSNLTIALVILGFGIVLEAFSFRTAIVEANAVRGTQGWWAFIRHSRNPELPVVLLEDAGAQIGLIIAFVSVLLAQYVDPVFDAYGTLAIGALLGVISVFLAVEMKSLLIGESASAGDVDRITGALTASPEVRGVIHLKTLHIGPDELLVAAKVDFDPGLPMADVAAAIDGAEARVREAVPMARVMYLEPDLARTTAQASSEA